MRTGNASVATLFLFAGLVNLAPVVGLFLPDRIPGAYGVEVADPNLLVLLRHRAGLFAIAGGLLGAAAFRPRLRVLAGVVGLYSMVSYCLLIWLGGPTNPQLARIALVDVAAIVATLAALLLDRRLRPGPAAG